MKHIYFVMSFIVIRLVIHPIERLFIDSECLKENYKGDLIPYTMGIIYIFDMLFISIVLYIFGPEKDHMNILLALVGILIIGLAGLIDDLIGSNKVRGLKGHIKKLVQLELTTGGLKAVFGAFTSIFISLLVSIDTLDFILNFITISLFTNFINLLDLRPGRALKGFLFFAVLFILAVNNVYEIILLSYIGASIAYLPYDLKARSMLGDIGSNSLGIILGITATSFPVYIKSILVIILIFVHIYCEKYSITKLILKNKILRYIDNLGR